MSDTVIDRDLDIMMTAARQAAAVKIPCMFLCPYPLCPSPPSTCVSICPPPGCFSSPRPSSCFFVLPCVLFCPRISVTIKTRPTASIQSSFPLKVFFRLRMCSFGGYLPSKHVVRSSFHKRSCLIKGVGGWGSLNLS